MRTHSHSILLLCLGLIMLARPAAADEHLSHGSSPLLTLFKDLQAGFVSGVYDTHTSQLNRTGLSLLLTSAANAYMTHEYSDQNVSGSFRLPLSESGSQLISDVGNWLPLATVGSFFTLSRFFSPQSLAGEKARDTATELVEAFGLTTITTYALKRTVTRMRPNEANHLSFPSGHTSSVFAVAGVLAYHYPWYVGIPSIAAASLVGLSRVDLKAHFPSDVIAGAGLGLFFATAIHWHHGHNHADSHGPKETMIVPLVADGTYGLSWLKTF